ncbi:hypothetical protein JX265_005769 [Neoarthrinium moseri]|uniref:Uncharacterized protein n=1 Tax=Neoarthrinium moseri TaxID=1658444 RepID=A0A9P9WNN1_9PEZI|nr:uncharacterized protein JN550_012297 [Neoarthrinium moseri]KAI1841288.1 hypothetical protein JX266_012524 [Neoarthrinium moseri]KAI1858939.1 hypothetical protein JN550_012297 [Neoarthrinium moseri]KAI1871783.1 hypothetical protein JX265_005769 [Neoarthrinium moseri]
MNEVEILKTELAREKKLNARLLTKLKQKDGSIKKQRAAIDRLEQECVGQDDTIDSLKHQILALDKEKHQLQGRFTKFEDKARTRAVRLWKQVIHVIDAMQSTRAPLKEVARLEGFLAAGAELGKEWEDARGFLEDSLTDERKELRVMSELAKELYVDVLNVRIEE